MTEFSFGVSFCKDVIQKPDYHNQMTSVLQAYATEGNVFCIHVLPSSFLSFPSGLANYGKFTGNRLIVEPLSGTYSEHMHLRLLKGKRKKIFFFSKETPSSFDHEYVKVINVLDFSKYSDFFQKREALQIHQDKLAKALANSVSGKGSVIEIREPFLKGKFIEELLNNKILNKCKITYYFSNISGMAWEAPYQWMEKAEKHDPRWKVISNEHYKKILEEKCQRYLDGIFDYLCNSNMSKEQENEAQRKIQTLKEQLWAFQQSDSIRFLFCILKMAYFSPPYYNSDRSAHWHHRFLRISDQKNIYTFESSHSFIHKHIQPRWCEGGELLHFRHSKNEEFDSFKKAFDVVVIRI